MHSNAGAQRAQHGVNGIVNAQHNMVQSGSQQAQQAGSNHSMQGSMQSLQGGQSQRAAGGSSTAFILWVDSQLKQRGQTEKRAALRQFIQASRDSSSTPEASKQLFALIGHDMIREWQAALRAGQGQGNGMHPLAASQHSSLPPQARPSPFPAAVAAVSTFRTQSCPPSVNGGNEGSWAPTPQVSVVQGVAPPGSQSDGSFVALNMHMNGSGMSGVNPSSSFSHGSVRLESHGQTHGSQRNGSLMLQATSVSVATNNAHQGLSKPKSSCGVHIVDVTESSNADAPPEPRVDEGLPFPAFELP